MRILILLMALAGGCRTADAKPPADSPAMQRAKATVDKMLAHVRANPKITLADLQQKLLPLAKEIQEDDELTRAEVKALDAYVKEKGKDLDSTIKRLQAESAKAQKAEPKK